MTTYTAFTPAANQSPPFQFLPTLDKQQYSVTTTWNMFGQRWYINVYSLSGGLVAVSYTHLTLPTIYSV